MKINNIIASLLAFSIVIFAYQIGCLTVLAGFIVALSELVIVYQAGKQFLHCPNEMGLVLMLGRMVFIPTIMMSAYIGNVMLLFALTTVLLLEIAKLTGFKFTDAPSKA